MKIKTILDQHRRDFKADYECENCGFINKNKSGYDDINFHQNVIPNMKCPKCGESAISSGANMIIKFPGRLPGLNEIIDAAKQGKGKYQPYALMKDRYTSEIGWLAKELPRYSRVDITITWYEPNRRRDPDNITGGQKFILDGLVAGGAIPDDSQRYINSIEHRFEVDRENPRIEIEVQEVNHDTF